MTEGSQGVIANRLRQNNPYPEIIPTSCLAFSGGFSNYCKKTAHLGCQTGLKTGIKAEMSYNCCNVVDISK